MSLDVKIQEADKHLSITAEGPCTLEHLCNLFDQAKEESERRAKTRVIVDTTGLAGTISNLDMHELGTHIRRVWNRTVRIAIVSPAGGLNKFLESLLWTWGIHAAIVSSQNAATEWVSGGM